MALTIEALDHLVLNVADVSVSAQWYVRVLGMKREDFRPADGGSSRTAVTFGSQKMNLRPLGTSQAEWFTANSPDAGNHDLCFLTRSAPQEVVEHLRTCGVPVELGPVPRTGAIGTLTSVYCRDPDGNLIEISSYR